MADAPKPSPPPASLEDPNNEKEIFASEVASVGVVHGNIVITLANVRVGEVVEGQQPKARRVVCGRIVLTNSAVGQLMNSLQRLGAQMEAAAKSPPTQPS
jgi:hypothetical protein